ncbi:50S ribosomal protein L13 [Buchnera aphidicola (Taiwanaphis decaspermi)]|uniref:50S ribosomal protein L13 n=1 Tax=Buchnera aphidicola TaxID=9 RepID=UPI0031B8637F
MKTFSANNKTIVKKWYCIDATNKILGRLSTIISTYLIGKHKIEYTPHVDTGDYIIIINASKIILTGNKKNKKFYYHHTGYIGGIKKISFKSLIINKPNRIIEHSVKGMMPKNSLGKEMFKKLKIYSGNKHNHYSNNPIFLNI